MKEGDVYDGNLQSFLPSFHLITYYYAFIPHMNAFGYYSGGLVSRVKELVLPTWLLYAS